ncbi:hypothetical protein WMF04_02285 [Sorangium sp. So ce260]|uniref:hypothetical protein n=1 Tax=Sorangium sp. So ce260 TaxID=3133291 RepID=UPI003F635CF2
MGVAIENVNVHIFRIVRLCPAWVVVRTGGFVIGIVSAPVPFSIDIDGFRREMTCGQDPVGGEACPSSTRVDETKTFRGSPETA